VVGALLDPSGYKKPAKGGTYSAFQAVGLTDEELLAISNTINVKSFGAKGDGIADDTKAIQQAIDEAAKVKKMVIVPSGIYLVEAVESVRLQSGVTLQLAKTAVFKAIPNKSERYAVMSIENVHDVTVIGGTIQGERKRHIGTTGEWGTGIEISGSTNITIQGTACNDCWGDGFYIGNESFIGDDNMGKRLAIPESVKLVDVRANNNRRQGISVISGRNLAIIRPLLANTKGTNPESGLDIEPNDPADLLENIVVSDAVTKGNAGAGILINLSLLSGAQAPADIKIANHKDDGSSWGMMIADLDISDVVTRGNVLVENPEWTNSQKNGLAITNHDQRSYGIVIRNPHIVNANSKGFQFEAMNQAAIAIYHELGNIPSRNGSIGNIIIYNPLITGTEALSRAAIPYYIWDDVPGHPIQDLSIVDPVLAGGMEKVTIDAATAAYLKYTGF